MIQRIRTLIRKEFLELRQNPRLLRPRHRRADPAADAARLCGDDRRPATCRSSSSTATASPASRAADRAIRRVAVLRHRRRGADPRAVDADLATRARLAGDRRCRAGLQARSRRGGAEPRADGADPRRRHRRQLVGRRARRTRRAWSASSTRRSRGRARRASPRRRHRRARPRLVQPGARKPGLHGPRRAGAAAAGRSRPTCRRWRSCASASSARSSS